MIFVRSPGVVGPTCRDPFVLLLLLGGRIVSFRRIGSDIFGRPLKDELHAGAVLAAIAGQISPLLPAGLVAGLIGVGISHVFSPDASVLVFVDLASDNGNVPHLGRRVKIVGRRPGGDRVELRPRSSRNVYGAFYPSRPKVIRDPVPDESVGVDVNVAVNHVLQREVVGVIDILWLAWIEVDSGRFRRRRRRRHFHRPGSLADVAALVLGLHPDVKGRADGQAGGFVVVRIHGGHRSGVFGQDVRFRNIDAGGGEVRIGGIGPGCPEARGKRVHVQAGRRGRRDEVAAHLALDDLRPLTGHAVTVHVPGADLISAAAGNIGIAEVRAGADARYPIKLLWVGRRAFLIRIFFGAFLPHLDFGFPRGRRRPGDHQIHNRIAVGSDLGNLVHCQPGDRRNHGHIRQIDLAGRQRRQHQGVVVGVVVVLFQSEFEGPVFPHPHPLHLHARRGQSILGVGHLHPVGGNQPQPLEVGSRLDHQFQAQALPRTA